MQKKSNKYIYLSNCLVYLQQFAPDAYVKIEMDGREKAIFGKNDADGEFLKHAILELKCNPAVYEWKHLEGFHNGVCIKCREAIY